MKPIVYVKWVDSSMAGATWEDIFNWKPNDLTCVSSGFLIHEDGDSITIGSSLAFSNLERKNEDGVFITSWSHGMTIPKCSIIEWYELELR